MKPDNVVDIRKAVKAYNALNLINVASTLRRFMGGLPGLSHNGKRDIYYIYGYPEDLGGNEGFRRMLRYSNRQGVANRVTYGMAHSCWRKGFELRTDPEREDSKVLEKELKQLRKRGMFNELERADVLNRIGRFSVLFVGVPDGKEPYEPVSRAGPNRLDQVYFQAYAYDAVELLEYETDESSPRYGLPTYYQLQVVNRRGDQKDRSTMQPLKVHWSRIVHLAENRLDSRIEGVSALEPVFNNVLDIEKACGGSAEAYFRNARRLLAYEVDKEFAPDLLNDDEAKAEFQAKAEQFTNQQRDHIIATGAKVHSLDATHESPLDTVKSSLWIVSCKTGIPLRVLTGEGSGQLAGSEDRLTYNSLVDDRQELFCSPAGMAVLEIIEGAGMLKVPEDAAPYFPKQGASTDKEQAEVDNKKADTLAKVMQAKSTVAGNGLSTKTALEEVGLSDVEYDDDPEPPELEPEPPQPEQ